MSRWSNQTRSRLNGCRRAASIRRLAIFKLLTAMRRDRQAWVDADFARGGKNMSSWLAHFGFPGFMVLAILCTANPSAAAPGYRVLGQPDLASTTLASRCAGSDARFNFTDDG